MFIWVKRLDVYLHQSNVLIIYYPLVGSFRFYSSCSKNKRWFFLDCFYLHWNCGNTNSVLKESLELHRTVNVCGAQTQWCSSLQTWTGVIPSADLSRLCVSADLFVVETCWMTPVCVYPFSDFCWWMWDLRIICIFTHKQEVTLVVWFYVLCGLWLVNLTGNYEDAPFQWCLEVNYSGCSWHYGTILIFPLMHSVILAFKGLNLKNGFLAFHLTVNFPEAFD